MRVWKMETEVLGRAGTVAQLSIRAGWPESDGSGQAGRWCQSGTRVLFSLFPVSWGEELPRRSAPLQAFLRFS